MSQYKEIKEKPGTENKGVHTEKHDSESLVDELRNVIELMGPSTPHFKSSRDDDSYSCSITITDHEKLNHPKNDECRTTPRDFSEYSSFATDTVEVYLEPKQPRSCPGKYQGNHNFQQVRSPTPNLKHFKSNPIEKITSLLGLKTDKDNKNTLDLYRINILQPKNENSPPKKVIFDLVDDIPKPCNNVATNTNPMSARVTASCQCCECLYYNDKLKGDGIINDDIQSMLVRHQSSRRTGVMQKETFYEPSHNSNNNMKLGNMAKVDVYYFDHGNSAYYHTTDSPPVIVTEIIAEKTENYTTKFWAEVFGTVQIGFSFFTSFILQFFKFILQSFVRPLTIGVMQIGSDYCFKPLLATLFNALIQPVLIFVYNIATSLRDICDPIAEGIGYFCREIAIILRAIRILDVRRDTMMCRNHEFIKKLEKRENTPSTKSNGNNK